MINNSISAIAIPGYRITELIYVGARTTVYRAYQEKTQMPVIIKILNAEYPQFRDLILFRNQFAIAQHIDHANIIKCYSLEPYGNSYALILEDFGGIFLSQYANFQPLELEEFFSIAIAITDALEFLYQNRIIHQDIKPRNILINPLSKQIKLIDFSISSILPKENAEIKNPNVLSGTLAYMSPEQTGRMNRGIDYRTDFYSLGVTFYELLTGQLPFKSTNPLELVHCHLAKEPISPREINPQIPQNVAKIIMKLMAKTAEKRYQTASGIRYDLEVCQQMLLNQGEIKSFELGKRDICDRFLIPEKLYGREEEVATLLNAFDRVSTGNIEFMLIAGFSGIGKTAVVNEVHKPIVRQKGYFISGKFDQFQRDIPFSALVQAFHSLMEQLLTESTAELLDWKAKILSALGEQGRVMIDIIPKLELIIGKQPEVVELTSSASQNRFNLLFSKFIQVLATKEHPLVIFLDDLQWADSASLKLIQLLMTEADVKYLLLIGAYRDNEVNPGHPFKITLDDLLQSQVTVNQITLKPLDEVNLNRLIADTLNCPEYEAVSLTKLVLSKTQGNPFFTSQLLKFLRDDGLITFNLDARYWQYNISEEQNIYIKNNVVELLAIQLQKLAESIQNTLKIAACIGNEFDLHTLSIVCQKSEVETASDLWKALQKGLILPKDEVYKLYQNESVSKDDQRWITDNKQLTVNYKFIHDRVQQAAYYLIPAVDKQATHLKIGRLILQNTTSAELEENIFEIVNQLNIGVDLIISQSEKYQLAKLNLLAGQKAKLATAYDAAVRYLNLGLGLLAADSWQQEYYLTLNIYVELVEAEYLNINFEQAITYIKIVQQQARTLIDQVKVYEAEIQIYIAQVQMQLAIDTGLKLLDMLGVSLEQALPQDLNIDDLIYLSTMTAPDKIAAMRVLISISSAAYFANPALLMPIVVTMINLSIKYGNSSASAYGYVFYGMLLCGLLSDIDSGYRYGKLALKLLDKLVAPEIKFRVLIFWNSSIKCWKLHIRQSIEPLRENIRCGLEVGDIEYVGYCSVNHIYNILFTGDNLVSVFKDIDQYSILMHNLKQQWTINVQSLWKQMVFNLLEVTADKYELNGSYFNQSQAIPSLIETNNYNILFSVYLVKTILFYLFKQRKSAVDSASLAKQYIDSVSGQIVVSQHNFYYSLALLAEYNNQDSSKQEQYLKQVVENQEIMNYWAVNAPNNYQHKLDLIEAEKARVLGNNWEAIELYDQAIRGAKENKYIQEEALANELAAEFYIVCGKQKIAQIYLIDAYYCYSHWGAKAKVEDLEECYAQLLAPILNPTIIGNYESDSVALISTVVNDSSSTDILAMLDLETVTKASLAISSEIQVDKLLHTLMQVILENVGAEKASLILQQDENLILVAQSQDKQQCELQSTPVTSSQDIPVSLINYVAHTREYLLLNDATTETNFAADTYVIQYQPKSILCTPILNQGKLIGIFYLENTLTVGAFTAERLQILKLLSSQAAISLENAQLYANLEGKVAARTQELNDKNLRLQQTLHELKVTQTQLVQTEKMSSLGQMVAGIAHEINNPINFIYANIEPAKNSIESLLHLIDVYQQEYPESTPIVQQVTEQIDLDFLGKDLNKIIRSMQLGAARIRQIVLGLRNFSRLDEADLKAVDIHEGIENTVMLLQPRLKDKSGDLKIVVIKEYAHLPLVNCYASQLNQVFMNVLNNAIDALRKHNKELSPAERKNYLSTITIHTQVINSDWVRISIKDNGCGMTEAVKQRIFDPFFTTKPVGEGTGLGLSISYQIVVDKHQGRIDCISEPGQGAEFVMEIPMEYSTTAKTS
ncbi:trifunctional serine/threonine-protein kinase/ATP-binding protein/sensor histidine kinase [Cylindrospermum sp. FACHB-282]|uniref:trifunctional serine/threonine-protein kinase/ATP-binding protein/sensor histidine kinase n=1 Tax=Cylindrospermum sp. FACHB-282 TaxID=2692794 RepID=UPI001688A99F|nr:ATP-binding sensor histidine kinase [Cylindrospermum sp. FACHB-282]MBD2386165.1 AAA family ATPase [Cylindrospermum sp. FACHB-282]